ncbi:antibiotic biosynthesis monooxygenase [Nonomuraea endophytica]|uniref:antibiotic biosynthesis monooxygenase n=1 Tax=Nonomuraea endophytica TaxID=714136 RepID=UPI0037CC87C0
MTLVFTWQVLPGREVAFEQWLAGVNAMAKQFTGHLGVMWLRPNKEDGQYHAILRFADAGSLERWLASDERGAWVERLDGIAHEAAPRMSSTGMEGWFSLPGRIVSPPRRWKMALTSFAAVYPCVLLFQWLVAGRLTELPLPLRALVLPVIMAPLLTYALMPWLSRVLRRWLYDE